MLRIDVDGGVWLKPGAAIAYRGNIAFDRLATLEAPSIRDAAFRELSPVVKASGQGRLYCGHRGEQVRIVALSGETLFVVWDELLAFEESLAFETGLVGQGVGLASGGLVQVKLSGTGSIAVITHGEPLTLTVTPDAPVSTDPHATIAWSGSLVPKLKTDLSWRSGFGHGGQEPIQMHFEGHGTVVVQPYKDPRRIALDSQVMKRLSSLVAG